MAKDGKIKNTLRVSFLDGLFASIMTGLSDTFFVPYCLILGGTTAQVGLLASIPNLIASLFQLKSSDAIDFIKSRKKILTTFVLIHALTWVPILLIPYAFKEHRVFYLIIFVTMYTAFNGFAIPAWSSMMSDYIPRKSRGKYFGFRNRTLGTVVVLTSLAAGFILKYANRYSAVAGFMIIFSLAFLARIISWHFLTQMYDPKMKTSKTSYFSFLDFVKRIKESNFTKFVFFVGSMNFAVNLAAPFFAVYMLRDLKLGYINYTVIMAASTLTTFVMMGMWGRHGDEVGNIRVLKASSLFIPIIPVLWLFSGNVLYLIVIQAVAGFFWAGFNISASNFIYDAVSAPKRPRCVAYFNVVNGTAIYCGAILGGLMATMLPPLRANRILCLFALSAILRLVVLRVFYDKIKEVRPSIKKVNNIELFSSMLGFNLD